MNLIIYAVTNKVNGKKYIGQSRQGLRRRKTEHISRFNLGERDHKLYRAMRKYGLENFVFEELCCVLEPEYLDRVEVEMIDHFNSFHRGYNMTRGGDSTSDETRAKISAALKGRKITWYDKVVASRKRLKLLRGPTFYGLKGWRSPLSRSYLIRLPDGSEQHIKGLRMFCRERGLDHATMLAVLAGKQRHHKGYSLLARFND